MSQNEESQDPEAFYDRMDEVMRALWGEHLHHGLWERPDLEANVAAEVTVRELGGRLDLPPGSRIIDVGCGYGATGVQLEKQFGFSVEGVTLSEKQRVNAVEGSRISVGDWLMGWGEDGAMDGVIALESLEHMPDTQGVMNHIARVLRPGGRLALASWVRVEDPTWLERWMFLEPIRRAGHLGGQTSALGIVRALRKAKFRDIKGEDFSKQAAPTWGACFSRGLRLAVTRPGVFRRLGWRESIRLGLTLPRIIIAYQLGLLRYLVIAATR